MPNKNKNKITKIAIVCSPGGHLEQALFVLDAFKNCEVFIVTYNFPTMKNFEYPGVNRVYYIKYFGDSIAEVFLTLFVSCFSYLKMFLKEKPQIIFSTGSEIAIPAFYIGKLFFGIKLIYLETMVRTDCPTVTAKYLYWISDLFLVQWESLLSKFGEKAKYVGRIL